METNAIITYANNALHAFGPIVFSTQDPAFAHLSFKSFVGEVEGNFGTGKFTLDVFELVSCGRRDGQPVPALLPPGQGSESRR
jgi:hypothetical protein